MKTLLLLITLATGWSYEPAVVQMRYDPVANGVAVLCRLNVNDLNNAILRETGEDPQLATSNATDRMDTLVKRYIVNHLQDVYGTTISKDLVSRVTDQVLKDLRDWQSRPLDAVYRPGFLRGSRWL